MNLEQYKTDGRILELRLSLVHSLFVREYGVERTTRFFQSLADIFDINWTIIIGVINRKDSIMALNHTNRERFRQEVVFMGALYNESRMHVGRNYLGLSKKTMYDHPQYDMNPKNFLKEEWLDQLAQTVVVCGVSAYRLEVMRFLDVLYGIGGVLGIVSMAKA